MNCTQISFHQELNSTKAQLHPGPVIVTEPHFPTEYLLDYFSARGINPTSSFPLIVCVHQRRKPHWKRKDKEQFSTAARWRSSLVGIINPPTPLSNPSHPIPNHRQQQHSACPQGREKSMLVMTTLGHNSARKHGDERHFVPVPPPPPPPPPAPLDTQRGS